MQEPTRTSLFDILQKNLKYVEKKTYIHRLIYFGDFHPHSVNDSRMIQMMFESNISLINEEFADVPLTGFGLFYNGYFINIIESTEECIVKHLKSISDSFNETVSNSPKVNRMKILIMCHHIIKRNFCNWFGRSAKPPVLLDKIEASTREDTIRQIQICTKKLLRMAEYLRKQPVGLIRATMDNISDVCQQYLPEVNLLDFLLNSPALVNVSDTLTALGSIPEPKFIEEYVWPIPTDFVPYTIVGADKSKVLMYTPTTEEDREIANEGEIIPEERNE